MPSTTPLDDLIPPVPRRLLTSASVWAGLAGALWPLQALAIAWSVSAWANGTDAGLLAAAFSFAALGILRAVLDRISARRAYSAADMVIADQRARLLDRETRQLERCASSADLAALLAQKLALLGPFLVRYRPAMARVMILPILFLGLTLWVSWAAALVLLVAGPLIPVFMALVGMAAREASARQMAEIGDMNSLLIDRITALPDIRLLNATGQSRADFARQAEGLRSRTMAVLRVAFLSSTVLELFSALGVAMVAVYVGFSLLGEITIGAWASPLTLGEGVFLLLLAPEFFQPLRELAAAWHDKAAAEAVADELVALKDGAGPAILGAGGSAAPLPGPAALGVNGVRLARGGAMLHFPDFKVEAGQSVALRGPSGAGKSTLLDLLAGLSSPDHGAITVAGQRLTEDNADAWRARVALVPQTIHVPDVTLRAFLDPDDTGTSPGAALMAAHAQDIVAALPDGLDTRLGETGAGVSGGEARRLLLARAFLSGADVILADEPTADLDRHTAARITEALLALAQGGRTVIVATHDPDLGAALGDIVDLEKAP